MRVGIPLLMVILLGSNIVSASSVFTVEEGEMWVDCNDCIIEISKDDRPCIFWYLRFFGRDFAPELTNSANGFLFRSAKHCDDNAKLMEELNPIYSKLNNLHFEAISSHNVDKL